MLTQPMDDPTPLLVVWWLFEIVVAGVLGVAVWRTVVSIYRRCFGGS